MLVDDCFTSLAEAMEWVYWYWLVSITFCPLRPWEYYLFQRYGRFLSYRSQTARIREVLMYLWTACMVTVCHILSIYLRSN